MSSTPSFLEFHTLERKRQMTAQHRRAASLRFLDVLNTKNFVLLDEMVTKDFKYMLSPASIASKLGDAVRDKGQMIETMKGIRVLISELNLKAYEVIVGDLDEGTAVVHAKSDGKTLSGAPYICEYVYTMRFGTSEGDRLKIATVMEFVDSLQLSYTLRSETEAIRDSNRKAEV